MFTRFIPISILFLLFTAACSAPATPSPTPTLPPEAAMGKAVFITQCGACHSVIEDIVVVGPSMAGIASRAGDRVEGEDARTYLYTSVLAPDRYLVDGFTNVMPLNFSKELTGEELDAVIAYLFTLE